MDKVQLGRQVLCCDDTFTTRRYGPLEHQTWRFLWGGLTRGFVGLIVEVKLGLVEFSRVLLGFIVGITEV